ncbi:unnamed protein product [Gongylonema pulchrum]|uniref:SCP domain-containing protein n=1 Tax=Gongylonema pulchrum TaxID=637853 RepID=A0A3P6T3X5_9BILA|nr:unnamed protein product [Gongylonema pulchrum]
MVLSVSSKCLGQSCSANGVTAEQREAFLRGHNDYRAKLASGQVTNKDGKPMPRGNIPSVSWDCGLEEAAKKWADDCKLIPAPLWERSGAGENMFTIYAPNNADGNERHS